MGIIIDENKTETDKLAQVTKELEKTQTRVKLLTEAVADLEARFEKLEKPTVSVIS